MASDSRRIAGPARGGVAARPDPDRHSRAAGRDYRGVQILQRHARVCRNRRGLGSQDLDKFLTNSREFVKGTFMIVKMTKEDRELVLHYLEQVALYRP